MRATLLTILLIGFAPGGVFSQDITIKVDYPTVALVGEQLRIVWTVNTGGGDFEAPSFEGFYKLSGPNTSYSSSTQIINGKITSETSYSYVFYIQALREGKYTIPGAGYIKGGKTYTSQDLQIEVIKDEAARTGAATVKDATSSVPSEGAEIYVKVILSKREVYIGEPIAATIKLFTRIDISGVNEVKYPSFNGFLREEIPTPQITSLERENVNGTIYGTGVFQKFLLYPQKSGDLTIDPVQITVLIRQRSGINDPFFGDVFQQFTTVPKMIASEVATVKVKPLPAGQPADFTGAVGKYELKAEINADTVNINDAVTLKLVLSGTGNLKLADAPIISFPAGLEVYDPKMTLDIDNRESGTNGKKTFEYLIIPRTSGDFTIPAISYSFFDPAIGQYRKISTIPFKINVPKSEMQTSSPQIFGTVPGEDIRYLGTDIRFIRTNVPGFGKTADRMLTRRSFYSLYGFAFLAFIVIIIARREQVRRNSDRSRVLNRRAGKVASRRLAAAHRYLKLSETEKFYDETLKAIWGYTSDKLNIPVSELTRTRAVDSLIGRGLDKKLIDSLVELADVCEMVRYAPSSSSNPKKVYDEATRIIKELEENLN